VHLLVKRILRYQHARYNDKKQLVISMFHRAFFNSVIDSAYVGVYQLLN